MSTEQPENPPAFPSPETENYDPVPGMSLRDYFAAKAMQGIVGAAVFDQKAEDMMKRAGIDVKRDTEAFVALVAYDIADAMLAERAK